MFGKKKMRGNNNKNKNKNGKTANNKNNRRLYRHGDLLIKQISSIPANKHLQELPTNVVMEGEATGHHHRLIGPGQQQILADVEKPQEKYLVVLEQPAQLVHEEHNPITIEEGMYAVVREQEFDPFQNMIRNVQD